MTSIIVKKMPSPSKPLSGPDRYYHICTDGTNNSVVHTCDQDFRNAIRISAIDANKYKVDILCYCHMSTHSHFVIRCQNQTQASGFAQSFKRDYSRYCYLTHGSFASYKRVDCTPIEICDYYYLLNCICYVLMNPVEAKIVKRPEDYPWSSINCYFYQGTVNGTPVRQYSVRQLRNILHSHQEIKAGMPWQIDSDGNIIPQSFVKGDVVEALFGGRYELYRSLTFTKSAEEETRYVNPVVRYNDNEVYAESVELARTKFGKASPKELTKSQKLVILKKLQAVTGASNKRLARVLKLDVREVNAIVGDIDRH